MFLRSFGVFAALVTSLVASTGPVQRPDQVPGTIKSSVVVVPLDVRVIDRNGNPVTDLTREDFEIFENGVRQAIGHFSTHALTADPALATAGLPRAGREAAGIEPANRRVFLLMLGRGRHEDVSRSISALESFVSQRLLPQDQVALLAWNRATDFTADHQRIRDTIRRYRDHHTRIETELREWFTSLRAIYGSREIPPFIQQQIDTVFAGPAGSEIRATRPGPVTGEGTVKKTLDRNTQMLIEQQVNEGRLFEKEMIRDPNPENYRDLIGLDFDQYVVQAVETLQDIGGLYAGLEYLRVLDGEKHLVLFTEAGLRLPRLEDATDVARVAANARITINTVQTGGTVAAPPPTSAFSRGGLQMSPVPSASQVANQGFAVRELRYIAETTGGRASAFAFGDEALDRLDRASRFQYLLSYSPGGPTDGKFRTIEVKVKRPGLTVLSRQGYFASPQPIGLDRARARAGWRIASAAQFERPIDDLKITMRPPEQTTTAAGKRLVLQLQVAITTISFVKEGPAHMAKLEIAIFGGDERGRLLQEVWEPLTLRLPDDAYRRYLSEGAPLRLDLPEVAGVRSVKVVLYDPGGDRVGSAMAQIR